MFAVKVIKIGLPVATATSAAIATTSLVSFSKKDSLQKEEDLDKELSDLLMPDEKYEDKELFYSKDGDGKNQELLDKALAEKLSKLLKEKGNLSDMQAPTPPLSRADLDNIVENAPNSRGKGVEHNDQQNSNPSNVDDNKSKRVIDQSHASEVGGSASSENDGFSVQMSVATEESNTESQGNDDQKHGVTGDTESLINLGKEASEPKDATTKYADDDSRQEGEDPQELKPFSTGGEPEAKNTKDLLTSKPQGDLTGNVVQTEEGSQEHVGSGSSDAVSGGQDGDFVEKQHKGTDSVGNEKEFTEEDLKKLGELGDQLSFVSGELMSLISD